MRSALTFGVLLMSGPLETSWLAAFRPCREERSSPHSPDAGATCMQADDEYMISDSDLFVNKFISVPKDMGQLNCAAFVAGIVRGVLDSAGFPAR